MEILDWLKNQKSAECQIAHDEIALLRANLSKPQPTSQASKIYNLYQYEIMDRTHVIRELIESSLLDNAGITPEQTKLAEKALESLGALYQNAGNNFKDKQ